MMKFKALTQFALIASATFGLAACASNPDMVAQTRALPAKGGDFNEALKQKYLDFVVWEHQEGDFNESAPYLAKAAAAANGETVEMDKAVDASVDIWRNKVVAVVAAVKSSDPKRAAAAQVGFDCYNHEVGEHEANLPGGNDPHGCKKLMIEALVSPMAEAAKPAAVAPLPSFIVYFEFNKTTLTADSKPVLAEAAKAIAKFHVSKISLEGNTDTVGPASYNQKLSSDRAVAVERALAGLGVSVTGPKVVAYGKTHLKVATPDETKELHNRRVEIHLEQ